MSDVIDLAKKLMSCASITPNDAGCQKILVKKLTALGFQCESMRFGDVDNLWARLGDQGPLLVLAGHTDVVPPGPDEDWTSPPFKPEIRDGYLYGRGAADMKGAIAAMVTAAEQFLEKTPAFSGSIAFLITSDEEGPSINGTKKVIETLQARGEKIDYCIIGEASSDKQLGDQIRIGRRGSLHGNLTLHGKQGHIANPHLAKNPIHLAMPILHTLAKTEWDKGNESFPPTTFQISNIHGGTGATNVIPGHLNVLLNFRFSTASSVKQLQERTEHILRKQGIAFDLVWENGGDPFLTKKGKLIPAVQRAIKSVTGLETKLSTGGGTSDGRFIAPTGAEVVELGVCNTTAHQVNECVSTHDLERLVTCYYESLKQVFLAHSKEAATVISASG
jgi:succinyl-diaminopimelate desuccinylase